MASSIGILYSNIAKLPPTPLVGAGSKEWQEWNEKVELEYAKSKKIMHLKHRVQFKKKYQNFQKQWKELEGTLLSEKDFSATLMRRSTHLRRRK